MEDTTVRTHFALTQERLAAWLGVPRASLALAERGHQPLTATDGTQVARLVLAMQGLAYDGAGGSYPAPPPLAPPLPAAEPLQHRLGQCRYQAGNLRYALAQMRRRAAPYEARLAAAPALRAWPGAAARALEARWLDSFEEEAVEKLRIDCGPGPQKMLEARLAGLEHEAALLDALLATLPPAP